MRHALILLLLVAPSVLAAAPAAVEADVVVAGSMWLDGTTAWRSEGAAVDLSEAARERAGLIHLSWEAASMRVVTNRWFSPDGERHAALPAQSETFVLDEGRLVDVACGEDCRVYVHTGDTGTLGLSGRVQGLVERLDDDATEWAEFPDRPRKDAFWHRIDAGAIELGRDGTHVDDARVHGDGTLVVFVKNATFTVETSEGQRVVDARASREALALGAGERRVTRFAVLTLDAAALATETGAPVRWMAGSTDVAFEGTLRAEDVTGRVRHGDAGATLRDVGVVIEGRLVLRFAPEDAGATDVPPLRLRVAGEAGRVDIAGAPVPGTPLATPLTVAAALVVLVALLRLVPWALYTRLDRANVLENPNRRRILHAIRDRPGVHASELAHRLALARVVVQHHLHHLQNHAYVASRLDGRARVYFAPETADAHHAVRVHAALRNRTRRRILDALSDGAWIAQRDIAARSGVPQRTVSYHLPALEAAGLVVAHGQAPRRYARVAADAPARVRTETA